MLSLFLHEIKLHNRIELKLLATYPTITSAHLKSHSAQIGFRIAKGTIPKRQTIYCSYFTQSAIIKLRSRGPQVLNDPKGNNKSFHLQIFIVTNQLQILYKLLEQSIVSASMHTSRIILQTCSAYANSKEPQVNQNGIPILQQILVSYQESSFMGSKISCFAV